MEKSQMINRTLFFAFLATAAVAANAQSARQMQTANVNPNVKFASYAQQVDKHGNLIGKRFNLAQNQIAPAAGPWTTIFDTTSSNPNGTAGTPESLNGTVFWNHYGGAVTNGYFGPGYNNPYNTNDMVTINPGEERKPATWFNTNVWVDSASPINVSILVTTSGGFIEDVPGDTENLGGIVVTWTGLTNLGSNILYSGDLSTVGLSIPGTLNGGAVSMAQGQIVNNTFVALPVTSQPMIHQIFSPIDPEAPGTNPSHSGFLQWDDDTPSDFAHGTGELYSYDFAATTGAFAGWFQAAMGLFRGQDTYVEGIVNYGGLADPAGRNPRLETTVELVAVDAAGTPLLDGSGNVIFAVQTVQLSANGEYRVLHPRLVDASSNPVDRYILSFKNYHWCRANSPVVNLASGTVTGVNVSPINGDVDGDNEVGPGDFAALAGEFLNAWDGTGDIEGFFATTGTADLDEDGEVGPGDFGILAGNFLAAGDDDLTP